MRADPRKQQKKQERHAARRKAKQQHLSRQRDAGLAGRLSAAARFPILHTWATEELWDGGMGWVCVSRALPAGQVAYAVFLVDRYCLGVKDVALGIAGRFTYENQIVRKIRKFSVRELTPPAARQLLEGAVRYAEGFGLQPHADYPKASQLFGDIDPAECIEEFEYGKDGKPFFISGPNDTPERCQRIMRLLYDRCGEGNFNYLVAISPNDSMEPLDEPAEVGGPG